MYGSVSSRFMCSTGAMKSTGATPPIPASPDEVNELRSEEKRSRFPQSRSRSTAALAGLGSALFGLSGALFKLTPGESMLSGVAAAACSTSVTEDGATLGGWIGLYRPSLFSSGCLFCCCCHCTDAKGPTCAIVHAISPSTCVCEVVQKFAGKQLMYFKSSQGKQASKQAIDTVDS